MTVQGPPRDLWTDPTDGYTVRAVESVAGVGPSPDSRFYGHSPESVYWELWCEKPDRVGPTIILGLCSKIHDRIPPGLLEFGFSSATHFMLQSFALGDVLTHDCGHGIAASFALRIGARPAVEALLAEIRADWSRRDPEWLLPGLGEIRAARAALDESTIERLQERYPVAAEYDRLDQEAQEISDSDDEDELGWKRRGLNYERLAIIERAQHELYTQESRVAVGQRLRGAVPERVLQALGRTMADCVEECFLEAGERWYEEDSVEEYIQALRKQAEVAGVEWKW